MQSHGILLEVFEQKFDEGKENGIAYSGRLSYTPIKTKISQLSTYFSLITIGTPTFRHGSGTNNFVIRDHPLGWKYGSDGTEVSTGFNYMKGNNIFVNGVVGKRKIGEESITSRPYDVYEDYLAGSFPSGIVNEKNFYSLSMKWIWKLNLQFEAKVEWDNLDGSQLIFGTNIYFPKNFKL